MISQSLILLDFIVSLCFPILNSIVVVGLYYGFLSTFAIGPSYLLLIRSRFMEEGGAEQKVAATTGFLTGQLMMFISIYYAPFHLALNRPHTITVLTLPYFFGYFLHKNDKHYYLDSGYSGYKLDSGYKNKNSIRKFRIYKVFLNNFLFQLLNPLLFPSSVLIRLMNIYLFRCNNKLLFLTSSFVGWLIGHIFLMKLIELILVWLQQKNSIKSKITIRFDKYIMLQFRNYAGQIFVVVSFSLFLFYLGKIPMPYYFLSEMIEFYENNELGVKSDLETEETKEEQKGSIKEDLSPYLFSEKDKTLYKSEEEEEKKENKFLLAASKIPLVTILFDFQRRIRPLRYITNDHFDNAVRNENSQFFFHICQSDGKERISFTYPPDLSTFLTMMEKKMDLFTRDKISYNELSNSWRSNNEEKRKKLSSEFFKRAKVLDKVLDKESLPSDVFDVFENRIRLCKDENQTKYLTNIYDPFLNGRFRGQIQESFSPETYPTNSILINKIHGLLLSINSHSPELEQKVDPFDRKSLLTEIGFFFNFMSKFSEKSKSVSSLNFDGFSLFPEHEQGKIYSEEKKRKKEFLFDTIRTDLNDQTIFTRKNCIGINEISKTVPRWSYNLIDELDQLADNIPKEALIRAAKADRIVIFTSPKENSKEDIPTMNITHTDDNEDSRPSKSDTIEPKKKNKELDENKELALLNYARDPDFYREIIWGSMRNMRRKTGSFQLLQKTANSPLFLYNIPKSSIVFDDLFYEISQYWKEYCRKPGTDNSEFLEFEKKLEQTKKEEQKDDDEKRLIEIEEAWESILYGLYMRSFVIIFQSLLRKYIILPTLIITKNIIRILLFQNPEWSEDLRDWKKEVHIKCTYQGIPISNQEFPKNWVTEGLQIRILSPFVLKAWHKSKVQSTEKKKRSTDKKNWNDKNFPFLTACGTQVESYLDYYVPNPFSFLGPIFKQINKHLKKSLKNHFFKVLKVSNERKKWVRTILKEIGKWNIQSILKSLQFRFNKIEELSESKNNSTISTNNPMILESPVLIQPSNWTNCSLTEKRIKLTEKRIKDLNVKTKTIIKEIEKMTQEEKEGIITSEIINLNLNKTTSDSDAKRLELENKIWKRLQRRTVRFTRKSYSFFKFFMERVYVDILLCIVRIPRINVQLFIESKKKIVNKSISNNSNKKTNAKRIEKTNPSIIPIMSIIEKSWDITDTNSQNSCDVSSLSQAYVFLKLSQIQGSNVDKSRLRSFFLKNLSESVMNQWTNWLKVHYQYDLPQSRWSRLVSQTWRKRINEQRVAQNKDFIEYDSDEKNRLNLYKQVDLDLLEFKKKMKKQYRYDRFSYQYLNYNYGDKKKSYSDGYRSPFETISDNTRKKEFFDIMDEDELSLQNYIVEDVFIDIDMEMEKKLDRKYFDWRVMGVERLNNSISKLKLNNSISKLKLNDSRSKSKLNDSILNPKLWFFLKLWRSYNAYQKNPWILPIKPLFFNFYGKEQDLSERKNISGKKKKIDTLSPSFESELNTQNRAKAESASRLDLNSSLSNENDEGSDRENGDLGPNLDRKDLKAERDFLLEKYLGFSLNSHISLHETLMDSVKFYCLLVRLKDIKKFSIISMKRGDISLDNMAIQTHTDFTLTEFKDNEELMEKQIFFIEPLRLSMKNYEEFFIYQTTRLSLIKNKRFQRNSENKDKNHYDLLIPENLLSTRRRRELRILLCFNPINPVDRNTRNYNENKINSQVLAKKKDLDREKKKLMNFKLFLWPNYRLEDLACINRYWFDTQNGSRFSILRIRMYPRLKI
uniref:hypothetical chloroplast RF1 n=1 Tax=Chesneya acaulis TaxID=1844621 RepID=UPI00202791FD|nr:hypothetical chloroplast RF1 [Chesneya acaulis]UPT34345.1 hypothetical chloroplast RF1 [Chesneya acaulis]